MTRPNVRKERVVEDIEELSPELRGEPFLEFPILDYGEIPVPERCVAENIFADRAELPVGRRNHYGAAVCETAVVSERGHC